MAHPGTIVHTDTPFAINIDPQGMLKGIKLDPHQFVTHSDHHRLDQTGQSIRHFHLFTQIPATKKGPEARYRCYPVKMKKAQKGQLQSWGTMPASAFRLAVTPLLPSILTNRWKKLNPLATKNPKPTPVVPYIAERYFLNQPLDHKIRRIQRWRLGYGK